MKHTYDTPKMFVMTTEKEDILTLSVSVFNTNGERKIDCSGWKTE